MRIFSVSTLLLCLLLAAPAAAQRIDKVFHNATTVLRSGDDLHVIMTGTGGGQAQFEILGKTKKFSMQETSFGRYEAHWSIPRGLDVQNGVVLVTLVVQGRQATEEASRLITVAANGTPVAAAPAFVVSPMGSVRFARPVIRVEFPEQVRSNSVDLFVDGVNFSRQANVSGQVLTWTPGFDLGLGNHKVEVAARGSSGQNLSHNWNFDTVRGASTPVSPSPVNPTAPAPVSPALTVTNMRNGTILGPNFNVQGKGIPGSTVSVTVEHPKMDVLSQLAGHKLRFQGQALVARDGTYSVLLDAGAVKRGQPMEITVTDSANSPAVNLTTERGNATQTTSTGTAPTAAMNFTPTPADGSVTTERRPRIGSTFDQRASKAKLVIDGRDFTQQARFSGQEIVWDAQWDLDMTQHSATVTAWVNGVQQSRSWKFKIDKVAVAPPPAPNPNGSQTYFDTQNGFGLTIPFNWVKATPDQNTVLKLTRGSQSTLEVAVAPNNNDVAGAVRALRDELAKRSVTVDTENQNKLGGFPATVLDCTKPNGGALMTIVATANNRLYIVALDSDTPGDRDVLAEVDEMLNSFVIR
ncbi:MAG: hypothetical protein AB7S38_39965 [Vulcanimicrobiota bacterium]